MWKQTKMKSTKLAVSIDLLSEESIASDRIGNEFCVSTWAAFRSEDFKSTQV